MEGWLRCLNTPLLTQKFPRISRLLVCTRATFEPSPDCWWCPPGLAALN